MHIDMLTIVRQIMPRPPTFYHPLRDIRKMTYSKTQADFAELAGVAPPTIQAIENGKLEISRKLALRIERATGADHRELLKGPSGKSMTVEGKKYTDGFYRSWLEQLNSSSESSLSGSLQQLGFWTRVLIQAANSDVEKKQRLSTVVHLLNEALDAVCQDCDLEQEVEALLTPMKKVEYQASSPKNGWPKQRSRGGGSTRFLDFIRVRKWSLRSSKSRVGHRGIQCQANWSRQLNSHHFNQSYREYYIY